MLDQAPSFCSAAVLFDLERDPAESYNVGNLYPDELAGLIRKADAFAAEIAGQRGAAEARALGLPG